MKTRSLFVALFVLAAFFNTAFADSFYSTQGLGLPHYYVSPQAAGMGHTGIGVRQYLAMNEMNPAALDLKEYTMVSVSFQGEIIDNTVADETVNTRQANASGFRFAMPILQRRLAVVASLKPLVRSRTLMRFDEEYDEFAMTRTANANGGVTSASLGAEYAIMPGLRVGAMFDFNFGAYTEVWETEFDDENYLDSKEDITSHLYGTGLQLGVLFTPFPFLSIGGIYKSGSSLTVETTTTTGAGVTLDPMNQNAQYPTSIGGGVSVELTKWLFAADAYTQLWGNYTVDGFSGSVKNYYRFSAGMEYVDSKDFLDSYVRRIAYRIGASYAKLPFVDTQGVQASEMFASVGFGFPFNRNLGRIDIAIEYGERWSAEAYPYSEELLRISASVTSAEKWFQRLYP